ncbi:MAG: response regulator [Dehalococcoidia bacterium]|nr:response regulator [Dehalococcoidia bacterium]
MSNETIRVLIVDDNGDTRENLKKMLYFEQDIKVVGTAAGGMQGVAMAKELQPHVVLMDINMPGLDGILTSEKLLAEVPASAIIMMSVQDEQAYMRRAMVAGASDYLVKPFSTDDLVNSIHRAYEREGVRHRILSAFPLSPSTTATLPPLVHAVETGKIISVFSPKGGAGTTTIAVNLACALSISTRKRVALLDCSLLFGDVAVMLNLVSRNSLFDLNALGNDRDLELIEELMVDHASGIRVLLAPPRPEMGEQVTADQVAAIVAKLRNLFDFIIVDTMHSFQDVMLAVLDASDTILVVTTPEVTALKNIKLFLETTEVLGYSPAKLLLVVNRMDSHGGIGLGEIESNVNYKVTCGIVNDWKLATFSVNRGVPFVMSSKESQISRDILALAGTVSTSEAAKSLPEGQPKSRGIGARIGMFKKKR